MSDDKPAWRPASTPTESGWYAVHYTLDIAKRSFCGVAYFDGLRLDRHLPIFLDRHLPIFELAGPFTNPGDAGLCAAEHIGLTF